MSATSFHNVRNDKRNSKTNSTCGAHFPYQYLQFQLWISTGIFNCLNTECKPFRVENRSPKRILRLCSPAESYICRLILNCMGNCCYCFYIFCHCTCFRMAFKLPHRCPLKQKWLANTYDFWVTYTKITRVLLNILMKSSERNIFFSWYSSMLFKRHWSISPNRFLAKRSTLLLTVEILSKM